MNRILLAMLAICFVGCSGKSNLRVDDLIFGNQRTGMRTESPTFKGGETVYLGYAIRGMSPDASGQAKLSYTISYSGESKPLVEVKNVAFKINSDLTAYGPKKPDPTAIPKHPSGDRTLRFEIVDEVSGERLTKEFPFTVESATEGPIDKRDAEHLAVCESNLKNIGLALEMYWTEHDYEYYPEDLSALVPGQLKVIPECFAAKEDTYSKSYRSNTAEVKSGKGELKPQFSLYCSGEHHKKAGLEKNKPAFDSVNGLSK